MRIIKMTIKKCNIVRFSSGNQIIFSAHNPTENEPKLEFKWNSLLYKMKIRKRRWKITTRRWFATETARCCRRATRTKKENFREQKHFCFKGYSGTTFWWYVRLFRGKTRNTALWSEIHNFLENTNLRNVPFEFTNIPDLSVHSIVHNIRNSDHNVETPANISMKFFINIWAESFIDLAITFSGHKFIIQV